MAGNVVKGYGNQCWSKRLSPPPPEANESTNREIRI
jgi:hypothetical protein